jgi:hypothetical protein
MNERSRLEGRPRNVSKTNLAGLDEHDAAAHLRYLVASALVDLSIGDIAGATATLHTAEAEWGATAAPLAVGPTPCGVCGRSSGKAAA